MKLPFSHFFLKQDPSSAVSTAWEFDIQLAEDRRIKFFALLILNKGPVDNQKILEQVSQRIMDTIRYQHHILEGNLVSVTNEDFFEQCLQKINTEISVFLREIAIALPVDSWAMLIGMLAPDPNAKRLQFYTSRFGEVTGWLLNNAQLETKKLINIFDAPDSISENQIPQKFFRNILASSIPKNDQLFFCTPNLLNYLSLSEMKNVLGTLSVASALKHFENQISFRPNDYLVSAMTIQLAPHPTIENKPAATTRAEAQLSINNLLDTQAKTEKLLGPSVGVGIKSIGKNLKQTIKTMTGRLSSGQSEVVPSQAGNKSPTIAQTIVSGVLTVVSLISKALKALLHNRLTKKDGRLPRKEKRMQLMSTNQTITKVSVWKKQLMRFFEPMARLLRQKGFVTIIKSPLAYIVVGLLVIVIVGTTTFRASKKESAQALAAAEETVAQISSNINKIDSHLIVGRDADAITLVQESQTLLNAVSAVTEISEDVEKLKSDLEERTRRLRKEIVISDPEIIVGDLSNLLGGEAKNSVKLGEQIVVLSDNPRKILRFNISDSSNPEILDITTDLNSFNDTQAISDSELILIDKNIISLVNLTTKSGTSNVANRQAELVGSASFNNRLYTLSPSENQVLRSNRSPSFSVFSDWLKDDSVDLRQGRDLAIDGSIYVLTSSGVVELLKNRAARPGLNLDPIEPALHDGQKLWTDGQSKKLYILEKDRLLVFEKTGKFVAQYKVEGHNNFLDMIIDEKNQAVFLLVSNEIIKISTE